MSVAATEPDDPRLERLGSADLPEVFEQFRAWMPLRWFSLASYDAMDGDLAYQGVARRVHYFGKVHHFEFRAYADCPKGSVRLFTDLPPEPSVKTDAWGEGFADRYRALIDWFRLDPIGGVQKFRLGEPYGPRRLNDWDYFHDEKFADLILKEVRRAGPGQLSVDDLIALIPERYALAESDLASPQPVPPYGGDYAWLNALPPWRGHLDGALGRFVVGHDASRQRIWGEKSQFLSFDADARLTLLPRGLERLDHLFY